MITTETTTAMPTTTDATVYFINIFIGAIPTPVGGEFFARHAALAAAREAAIKSGEGVAQITKATHGGRRRRIWGNVYPIGKRSWVMRYPTNT